MSEPGSRAFGEDLAPVYDVTVNDIAICADITKYIQSVVFENDVNMADKMELSISNPYFALTDDRNWINYKAFQPGNEMEVWNGYGRPDTFLGRAVIQKHAPKFPFDEYPHLSIKSYDKSYLMMKVMGDIEGARGWKINLAEPRPQDKADNQGVSWVDMLHSDVVRLVAEKYAMATDIEPTNRTDTIVQKKGMTDWQLVKGLANLNGMECWVDWDYLAKSWTFHWRRPNDEASPGYKFAYQSGEKTTLLSCEMEYGITEALTTLSVLAWDWYNEKWVTVVIVEDAESADPTFKKGPAPRVKGETNSMTIEEVIESASEFRLAAAGVALDVVGEHQFKDADSLARFAQEWFLTRKNNFMIAKGVTVGVETLRARQVHELSNLSKRLDGPYYFVNVKHKMSADGGYVCEFTARKILTS